MYCTGGTEHFSHIDMSAIKSIQHMLYVVYTEEVVVGLLLLFNTIYQIAEVYLYIQRFAN